MDVYNEVEYLILTEFLNLKAINEETGLGFLRFVPI